MQNDSIQNDSNPNPEMEHDGTRNAGGTHPAEHAVDIPVDLDPMDIPDADDGDAGSRVSILDELADAPEREMSDEERQALEAEAQEAAAEAQEAAADADEAAAAYARASMRDFDKPVEESPVDEGDGPVMVQREKPKQLVVVNDVPGDEMRIAILEQGKLAQFYGERASNSTNVGSIYKARVVNVEPAIQAAFVDFGEGANGFLHISDLHPKYFPGAKRDGGERTEKVGRKIPRRARPMMQDALKRGQEIIVQVLKEGLGSKGPTVTSYLSIPGRLLVMMPDMDNVGVSRKVDDEEGRRKMRKILDSLNLPEGFGFILRTAGFDATRSELARDAQYLTRLWQVMEKRMNAVGAPCQLYTEGDILLRTIRDSIDASVDGIVVDSEPAFHRAKAFLEVVAPKAATRVHYYDRRMPVFHAFDVERQVDTIHAREVPLPSGGALVIDQAEALVAIDVNSGRSRSARDSETNAYQTNQEAVDEIARQLRLRDLGGVVICDLIDMRSAKHRRDIEERLKKNLSRDRAKTTVSQISEFGIVELTRQRMRPSIRKAHYIDCPHCAGHGEIRMPDSVAADAMRRVQLVLDMEKVSRIELVCSSKVAAVLLSTKRRAMVELEDLFSKKIGVRISEAIAVDRVDIYAYDDRDADVEFDRPQRPQIPALASLP
ncbi:MAG: ribonuclease E/G, partial [bacterium]